MRNTVSQTYVSYYWFFIVYRFVVGLIFSQLLVGILVTIFQNTEAERGTITGEVRLALSKSAKVLTPAEQVKLQRELGVLAASLLDSSSTQNPAFDQEVLTRFGDDMAARLKRELIEDGDASIRAVFDTLDTSGDRSVSLEELLKLGQEMLGEDKWTVATNMAAFSLLDVNGDGAVDIEEFAVISGGASNEKFKMLIHIYNEVSPKGDDTKLDHVVDN